MNPFTAMLSFVILMAATGHAVAQGIDTRPMLVGPPDAPGNASALPVLSLGEALRAAADTHPSVALRIAEQSSSEYGLEGARWQRWPGMSLSSSRGPFGNALTEVQFEQPLWTGGRITANVNAAEARLEAARSSVAEAKQLIVERAVNAFADALRLQERLAGAQAAIADYEQLTAMIDRRVAGGVSPRNDGTSVRARLQQARSEQLQMRLQLDNARAELEVLVGRRFGELAQPLTPRLGLATLDEALDASLASAPQLGRLSAEERAAEETITAARSKLSPALSVRYNKLFGGGTLYASDQVFVGVSFQPGSGLSSMSAISEAESRRTGAMHSRETARRDIVDRVRSLWNLAESSRGEVAVLHELVRSTQQVYESCLRQFPVGRRTWLEVLLARRDATQAQYALSDARWSGFASVLKLELTTGRLAARNFRPEYESAE
ncbi:MAG: TolC family protein [Burkholderiaceae bacterium]|nr:TolC family protein [Burkholderiaceae bacterium]